MQRRPAQVPQPRRLDKTRMTYIDAAIMVLKTARKPMTTADITAAAISKGFIRPRGKTPTATMSAALYSHARTLRTGIRREYRPGPNRAVRHSVRWVYKDILAGT